MGKQRHNNDDIKRKIDNYEFGFDDHAWEKMEKLLDNPKPTRSFFNLKNLGLMFTIMLFIYMGVQLFTFGNQSAVDNQQLTLSNEQSIIENQNSNTQNPIVKQPNIQTSEQPNNPIVKQSNIQTSEQPSNLTFKQSNNLAIEQPKPDSAFLTELTKIHAAHNKHYNPEKTYLQLDRTLYKPGESIWFTAYLRDAATHKRSSKSELVYIELIAPNGGILKTLTLTTNDGSVGGDFQLTADVVGGLYKIKAYTKWQQNTNDYFERSIQVQKTVLPNLLMELDFEREAYGSGDKAVAKLELKSLENTPLANHNFELKILLDGQQEAVSSGKTDNLGRAKVSYTLPSILTTNDGLFNVVIQYNGQAESISRAIPIILNQVDLQFLPEGGEMIADLSSKIAFKAINEFGKPADVKGIIKDSKGNIVTNFRSYHQGMGAFDFVPKNGEIYTAQITKPANISQTYTLPTALVRGYSIGIEKQYGDSLFVKISSSEKEQLYLAARSRDKIYHTVAIKAIKGTQTIALNTQDMPIGISEVTLFDSKKIARSERLVFLNYDKKLNINITTDKEKYQPREKVTLTLNVTDERGMPMPGTFSMAIVDDKMLSYADNKQGSILGYMLLESELKGEVIEPNFYFEPKGKHPDKDQILALDYLMLTQGWRKFDWNEMEKATAEMPFKPERKEVRGQIVNGFDKPVEGATITISETGQTTTTDKEGNYAITDIIIIPPFNLDITDTAFPKKRIPVPNYGTFNAKVDFKAKTKIYATKGNSQLRGKIIDSESGEPLVFSQVVLSKDGIVKTGANADLDGIYQLRNIEDGMYDMEVSYLGYQPIKIKNIKVEENKIVTADIAMNPSSVNLESVVITAYKKPLIQRDNTAVSKISSNTISSKKRGRSKNKTKRGNKKSTKNERIASQTTSQVTLRSEPINKTSPNNTIITTEEVAKLPSRDISGITATTAGVTEVNEMISVPTSRSIPEDAYIDRVKIKKNKNKKAKSNLILPGTPAKEANESNIDELIQGKVAGVDIKNKQREQQQTVRIRGLNSISSTTQPLYVIDGVAVLEQQIKDINPEHIKSINILKNETATALYGNNAANGVVIITTKGNNKAIPTEYKSYINTLEKDILTREKEYNIAYQQLQGSIKRGDFTELEEQLKTLENLKSDLSTDTEVVLDLANTFNQESLIETKELANTDAFTKLLDSYNYAKDFKEGFYISRKFYAPKYKTNAPIMPQIRNDFRSTIHWEPKVEVERNGKATITFYNSDAITTFKAVIEGFGTDGSLGRGEQTYYTQLPIGMLAKAPTNVLTGDQVAIPLTLMNNTDEFVEGKLSITAPQGFKAVDFINLKQRLNAKESRTIELVYDVMNNATDGVFQIQFESNGHFDAFIQSITVLQRGFPIEEVFAGNSATKTFDLDIKAPIQGTVSAKFTAYPSVLDELVTGLERMLRQPTGCFEQTSSSNYPNILVLDYLKSTNTAKPETVAKANRLLEAGYNRLLTFEVKGGGFDWYGKPPSHEALTAYGLMEFVDMQQVYPVEQELIDRTASFLLSRKDGKGSWKNAKAGYHRWEGKNAEVRDAYIVWAITEAGFGNQITKELEKSYNDAIKTEDPYIMALLANSLMNVQDNQRASELLTSLVAMQANDGSWTGLTHSMTHSTGKGLKVETTALAALAILKNNNNAEANNIHIQALEQGINFIASSKSSYGFGNTQSTILAMKALVTYAKYAKTMSSDGEILLFVDGKKVGTQTFTNTQADLIIFDNLEKYLTEGKHQVYVKFAKTDKPLPYDLSLAYSTTQPRSDAKCVVDLKTELANTTTKVGETVRLTTTLTNTKNEAIPNTIAIVGIPSGLTLQPWQLKDLQEKGTFDYYEIMGQYIVFHYRGMDANAIKIINLDLKAAIGGQFEAPASSAYLYYTNEYKVWSKPERVDIRF